MAILNNMAPNLEGLHLHRGVFCGDRYYDLLESSFNQHCVLKRLALATYNLWQVEMEEVGYYQLRSISQNFPCLDTLIIHERLHVPAMRLFNGEDKEIAVGLTQNSFS